MPAYMGYGDTPVAEQTAFLGGDDTDLERRRSHPRDHPVQPPEHGAGGCKVRFMIMEDLQVMGMDQVSNLQGKPLVVEVAGR